MAHGIAHECRGPTAGVRVCFRFVTGTPCDRNMRTLPCAACWEMLPVAQQTCSLMFNQTPGLATPAAALFGTAADVSQGDNLFIDRGVERALRTGKPGRGAFGGERCSTGVTITRDFHLTAGGARRRRFAGFCLTAPCTAFYQPLHPPSHKDLRFFVGHNPRRKSRSRRCRRDLRLPFQP